MVIELSQMLCLKHGYSRVDFLITDENIYFSEITLTPNAGRMIIKPSEWDSKLGEYWQSF
jgi:D-alanine-D-alanine ligase-like ATP-grasp enzyme